jgi:RNA polymerase sigma-54 factor
LLNNYFNHMRQTLQLKQSLKLSPQQIQVMKLLQLPTASLDQRIKEELEANPALEEGDEEFGDVRYDYDSPSKESNTDDEERNEFENQLNDPVEYEEDIYTRMDNEIYGDYMDFNDSSYGNHHEMSYGLDEEPRTIPIAVECSFHEYLQQQIGLLNLKDEREITVAKQIIGSIDEDGYLRRDTIAIIDDLVFTQNVHTTIEEVEAILKKIQRLDPPGLGARNLQECLYIQLEQKAEQENLSPYELTTIRNAIMIIQNHFEEFTKKHYPKLQRYLNVNEKQLKEIIDDTILKLNPKPASSYVGSNTRAVNYVLPDFNISNQEGVLELTLNSKNAPDLRISEQYKDMIREYKASKERQKVTRSQRDAVLFAKQKIDSAKWFIDAIRQRQITMESTMYAIMTYQQEYFLTGDEKKLKPMILKDIAEMTGLDISTVSRVANSKYVETEYGTRRLKDFFSESLTNEDGDEVSTLEVKKILSELVSGESKKKPHSDEKLKSMLQKQGYNIARRTVAKYREQLNIPVARLRKAL